MPLHIIKHLSSNSSRSFKEMTLEIHKDNDLLKKVLFYTYNPYYNFYLRKLRQYENKSSVENETNYVRLFDLLDRLRARVHTGNEAIIKALEFVEQSCPDGAELLYRILERDLDCGVQISTVNKIWDNLIPKFSCMLAHTDTPEFPCVAEEKFDGVRIITVVDNGKISFFTRNGSPLDLPKIRKEIQETVNNSVEEFILDGEIIGKDRKSCSGLVNKFIKNTAKDGDDEDFVYMVFDAMPLADWLDQESEEFSERRKLLCLLFNLSNWNRVKVVDSTEVKDMDEVNEFYERVVAQGGEGLILKDPDHCYEWKRSKAWLKLKEENTIDLIVVDVLEGRGKYAGGLGSLLCEDASGTLQVRVGSGLSEADISEFNADSPIGKIVEVEYNTVISNKHNPSKKSLFLPRFKKIREDKSEADSI